MTYKHLYNDVLSVVFSYLTLKEMVSGALTHKKWLHVSTLIPCRNESFSHKKGETVNDAFLAMKSQYAYHITSWDISYMLEKVNQDKLLTIVKTIEQNKFVTSIDLSNNNLNKYYNEIMGAIKKSECPITSINLNSTQICTKNAIYIAEVLKDIPGLKMINLGNNWFKNKGAIAIASVISKHSETITSIDFSCNCIGNEGIMAIATSVQECTSLISIDFNKNNFVLEGNVALFSAIEKSPSPITSIIMHGDYIGSSTSVQALASLIDTKPTLTLVDVNFCSIDDGGVQCLMSSIEKSGSFLQIDLSYNQKIDNILSFQTISNAVKKNHQIKSLSLSGIILDIDAISVIGDCISQSTTIHSIELRHCGLDAQCLLVIADMMRRNKSLASIDLGYNNKNTNVINDKRMVKTAMESIADAIASSTSLTSFDFSGNNLDPTYSKIIISGISHCPTIKEIILSSNVIGFESLKILDISCFQISRIDFDQCDFDYQKANVIASIISNKKRAISLISLNCCGIDYKSAKIIAEAAAEVPSLTSIDLGCNKIGDDFIPVIGAILQKNKSLAFIETRYNN